MCGISPTSWITYPIDAAAGRIPLSVGVLATMTSPAVGSIRRLTVFKGVVLPDPLVAKREHTSPLATLSVTL